MHEYFTGRHLAGHALLHGGSIIKMGTYTRAYTTHNTQNVA